MHSVCGVATEAICWLSNHRRSIDIISPRIDNRPECHAATLHVDFYVSISQFSQFTKLHLVGIIGGNGIYYSDLFLLLYKTEVIGFLINFERDLCLHIGSRFYRNDILLG